MQKSLESVCTVLQASASALNWFRRPKDQILFHLHKLPSRRGRLNDRQQQ